MLSWDDSNRRTTNSQSWSIDCIDSLQVKNMNFWHKTGAPTLNWCRCVLPLLLNLKSSSAFLKSLIGWRSPKRRDSATTPTHLRTPWRISTVAVAQEIESQVCFEIWGFYSRRSIYKEFGQLTLDLDEWVSSVLCDSSQFQGCSQFSIKRVVDWIYDSISHIKPWIKSNFGIWLITE